MNLETKKRLPVTTVAARTAMTRYRSRIGGAQWANASEVYQFRFVTSPLRDDILPCPEPKCELPFGHQGLHIPYQNPDTTFAQKGPGGP